MRWAPELGLRVGSRSQIEVVLPLTVASHQDHNTRGVSTFGPLAVNVPGRVVPVPQIAAFDMMVRENLEPRTRGKRYGRPSWSTR